MRIQLPSGEYRNELRQPLWDVIFLAAGVDPSSVGPQTFFQNITGKTLSQTNLVLAGQLEADVSFRCLGMALDAQTTNPLNQNVLPLVMERSYFKFLITNTVFYQANGTYVCGRISEHSAIGVAAAGPTTSYFYQRLGDVAVQAVGFSGKHVIDIGSLQSFGVTWAVENLSPAEIVQATPNTQIQLLMSLKGLQRRPVL